jgi:hypothetical protein
VTAEEVIALATELGHSVRLTPDGGLTLTGKPQPETPLLVRVLTVHRAEILDRLGAGPAKSLDRKAFRARLEAFWHETGWTPAGGWLTGERDRPTERY